MKEFIEIAIHDIMEHAKNVSNAAKSNCLKEAYLMGAEHACDVLKVFTESNDVQIVVFCRNCVFWNEKTVFGNEGRRMSRIRIN